MSENGLETIIALYIDKISYHLEGAIAGEICCLVTHGAACPIDVVKMRMQSSQRSIIIA